MREALKKQFKGDFFLLVEAGFVAINQKSEENAKKIFRTAELLDPESSTPKIGFGFISLHKLELVQAKKLFLEVLEKEPAHHLASVFLGISLAFDPKTRAEGKKRMEEVAENTEEPALKQLAVTSLEWVKHDFENRRL